MRTGLDTKTLILNHAGRLLRTKGFNGFSYKDISGPLGIRNAAVHYHFATKADLGVALIQRYRSILRQSAERFARDRDARAQLEGYLCFMLKEHSDCDEICPLGIIAADYFTVPDAMRDQAQKLVKEMLAWMTEVLEVGREQGVFSFEGSAEDKALCVKATTQGAGQLARLSGEAWLERAMGQIRRDLGMAVEAEPQAAAG